MPVYKLTYFNTRGRAEITRIMLAYVGKKFTDNRLEQEEWLKLKDGTPLGNLPMLEIDGGKVTIVQSLAIARYIARETGLAGKDCLQQAQVDMILETLNEILPHKAAILFEADAEKKAELEKTFNDAFLPRVLTFLEKTMASNSANSGFLVGKSVTLADFFVWHMLEYQINDDANCLESYPKLKANRQKVSSLSKFAEYLKNRPKTPY